MTGKADQRPGPDGPLRTFTRAHFVEQTGTTYPIAASCSPTRWPGGGSPVAAVPVFY